ncbi:MAG: phenylalanine--tRNA ligase subunit alpha [Candidatus Nanohaloarchaeota archaeon]|nr:phenylalanine--tRNA ligase subunit alpha [Candidatus Nanohaloarchaeota archaeon]
MVKESITALTPEIIKNWQNYDFKKFDVVREKGEKIYTGKIHPVNQVIEYVRRIWLDMGFKEMKGNKIVQAFWNFDALFTPQDHPAREMQDTFYLKASANKIDAPPSIIKRVKEMHEKGDERSEGWQYKWSEKLASKYVLRTHTTALSALTLASLTEKDLPAKYFAIGKVFRNETLDWKHLFEFYQVEGFVADNSVNFRHLLGYLKVFFQKMGYDKIRVRPAYFPYTELSLEIEVFMPDKGWVELAGAGIFRPEVVKPLIGKEIKVLAWGLGLERIIMNYYGFKDIRDVYTKNIDLLRNLKRWYY